MICTSSVLKNKITIPVDEIMISSRKQSLFSKQPFFIVKYRWIYALINWYNFKCFSNWTNNTKFCFVLKGLGVHDGLKILVQKTPADWNPTHHCIVDILLNWQYYITQSWHLDVYTYNHCGPALRAYNLTEQI